MSIYDCAYWLLLLLDDEQELLSCFEWQHSLQVSFDSDITRAYSSYTWWSKRFLILFANFELLHQFAHQAGWAEWFSHIAPLRRDGNDWIISPIVEIYYLLGVLQISIKGHREGGGAQSSLMMYQWFDVNKNITN